MLFENHARPEADNSPRRDLDLLARFRVAALPGIFAPYHEVSEPRKLYGFTLFKNLLDQIQNHLYQLFSILFRQADFVKNFRDEICLGHSALLYAAYYSAQPLQSQGKIAFSRQEKYVLYIKQAQDQHLKAHILREFWTAEDSDGFYNPAMAWESLAKSVDEAQKGIKIPADDMAPKQMTHQTLQHLFRPKRGMNAPLFFVAKEQLILLFPS
jgi:hypothetical protein